VKISIILTLLLIPLTGIAFADTTDDAEMLLDELTKFKDDYVRIMCLMIPTDSQPDECLNLPSEAQPEYAGLSNIEMMEKFFKQMIESNKRIEENPMLEIDYFSLPKDQILKKFKEDMIVTNQIIHEISVGLSELEYRGFTITPIRSFDQECIPYQDLIMDEPQLELPKSTASEFEIHKWISEFDEILYQHSLLMEWQVGENFENVTAEQDKKILREFKEPIDNLNHAVKQLKEQRSLENIQAVRDALEQIENFPEIYTKKIILSMVDADPETGELIITTSIKSLNYFEDEFENSECMKSSHSSNIEEMEQLKQEPQLESPLQFVEYRVDSIPSPNEQMEMGIFSQSVTCSDGLELLMRPGLESSACVKPSSVEKLLERDWMFPDLI